MAQSEPKLNEPGFSESDSNVIDGEKNLILLKTGEKRNLDQTISAPDQFASQYHYNTKNIDKYVQLCPHCKKPTLSALDRTVIDSATDYLNGKRILKNNSATPASFLQSFLIMIAFSTVVYFIVSHI